MLFKKSTNSNLTRPKHPMQEQQNAKMLFILPLITLPFLSLLFWSLGGGRMQEAKATDPASGLNLNLPEVSLQENRPQSKMDHYKKAASDSARFLDLIKNDPHYDAMAFRPSDRDGNESLAEASWTENNAMNSSLQGLSNQQEQNEERVLQKLEALNRELNRIEDPNAHQPLPAPIEPYSATTAMNSADIDRLEQMMLAMSSPSEEDEEIIQLNGMLEKILDIQHPGRVEEKLKQNSIDRKGQVFAIAPAEAIVPLSSLATEATPASSAFFSLTDPELELVNENAIQAVIHQSQSLVSGSTVKLRLLEDVFINGMLIPRNQFIYGKASLSGERLSIKINSIRYKNSLFPVDLSVYDLDGLSGISIPGSMAGELAKESADRSMQNLGLATFDASVAAQASAAGIDAAKNLLRRKVKLVKVNLKAGYKVLLKDEKQH